MIEENFWRVHYQILLIMWMKEVITLNVNMDNRIKNVKLVEFNATTATAFLNKHSFKMI